MEASVGEIRSELVARMRGRADELADRVLVRGHGIADPAAVADPTYPQR